MQRKTPATRNKIPQRGTNNVGPVDENEYIEIPRFIERFRNQNNIVMKLSSFQVNFAIYEYLFLMAVLLAVEIFVNDSVV